MASTSNIPLTAEYTVAWISAIGKEYEFACELFDEEHETPSDLRGDDSCYRFGRVSGHNVIMAKLPEGIAGTSPATELATKITSSFPSLRLGDVVVSVPVSSQRAPGVLNYQFDSSDQGTGFQLRGFLNSPPGLLLNAVSKLKSYRGYARRVDETIQDVIKKAEPELEEYRRPPSNTDVLYKTSFKHTDRNIPCSTLCLSATSVVVVERVNRSSSIPVFHYGTIGSANDLMRDPTVRDTLASEQGILCLEMESAGLMNTNFRCLVIRGISDYADTHKNDMWHGYAAAAAAAYAKHLLKCIRPQDARQERNMCNGSQVPQRTINHLLAQEEYTSLLDSLIFPNMHGRLLNIHPAMAETCGWLFCHESFKAWVDKSRSHEHNGFLWIKRKPGSGKSTLMKEILNWANQLRPKEMVISYFFNARATDTLERSTVGLYRSLLHQLISSLGSAVLQAIDPMFLPKTLERKQPQEIKHWSERELQNLFVEIIRAGRSLPLTIVIDALDEGEEEEVRRSVAFFEELDWRTRPAAAPLRICLSSRPYPNISIDKGLFVTVEEQPGHSTDIRSYIDQKLRLGHPKQMGELRAEVARKSAGVFLWVELVVRKLNQAYDGEKRLDEMMGVLEQVPPDLQNLFADILHKSNRDFNECITLLRWVLFSRRVLRPKELYIAIKQTHVPSMMDHAHSIDEESSIRYILDCSRGLVQTVEVDPWEVYEWWSTYRGPDASEAEEHEKPEALAVQFIHESVRDYLQQTKYLVEDRSSARRHLDIATVSSNTSVSQDSQGGETRLVSQADVCHTEIAETCLRYLLCLSEQPLETEEQVTRRPLARYAARYWFQHLRTCSRPRNRKLCDVVSNFLKCSNALLTWLRLFDVDKRDSNLELTAADTAPPLYYAAKIGVSEVVSDMILSGVDVNAQGGYDGSALQTASAEGHAEVVEMLLDAGAHIDAWIGGRENALYAASDNANETTVRLLIDRGADVNARGGEVGSPLHIASLSGPLETVKMLLQAGADVNAVSEHVGTPLCAASSTKGSEREALLTLLLEAGADVNVQGGRYGNALAAASGLLGGDVEKVQILLKAGANVNAQGGEYGSALYAAVYWGRVRIVEILLDTGANVDAPGGEYGSALCAAVYLDRARIMEILLDAGANVDAQGDEFGSALCAAASEGDDQIVKILLAAGADVNLCVGECSPYGKEYRNALQAAKLREFNEEVVQLLLNAGAVDSM
ncbi:hypothetical protein LTR70_010745 [Exophiala xenobiotica]|uniref:Nephrocystin 3-like N-terminal domain-containing protein n=1 Tax=Lithohypha guttulata TaxID=1690604 RepID=A0ABR0JTC8_9EURO|nr:hypothetical protein LTR24_010584 [Lithohypha guttulata]KAK5308909.1 hypothetical protein LTR70_010745 [Exophiala xenobiotica]